MESVCEFFTIMPKFCYIRPLLIISDLCTNQRNVSRGKALLKELFKNSSDIRQSKNCAKTRENYSHF